MKSIRDPGMESSSWEPFTPQKLLRECSSPGTSYFTSEERNLKVSCTSPENRGERFKSKPLRDQIKKRSYIHQVHWTMARGASNYVGHEFLKKV